ncbi:MAG: PAS domain-containing protein, partial [Pseudomonadota bacterium]
MQSLSAVDALDGVESPIFVLGTNAANHVVYTAVNRATCELFRVKKDEVIGKTALEVIDASRCKPVYGRHVMAMCTGLPTAYDITVEISGRSHLLHTQLMPLRNREGDVVTVLGTTQPMSSAYAERESRSHNVLDEAEQFIALAAHDLRSPIRNLASVVTMLAETIGELDDEQPRAAARVRRVHRPRPGPGGRLPLPRLAHADGSGRGARPRGAGRLPGGQPPAG